MKSRASLFLTVLLLALSLTACGKEPAKNDRNDAGSGQNSAYDAVSDSNRDNVPNNDAIIGRDDHTVTAPDTNPAQPRQRACRRPSRRVYGPDAPQRPCP